ncbi:MAG: holo-ACP synthase [Pseudomonadota bacterium]
MILGIGTDLCAIDRIERNLQRFSQRFITRLFLPDERILCERNPTLRAGRYAMFFAAKEAAAKALGTGLWRRQIGWHSIEIKRLESGGAELKFHGSAWQILQQRCPGRYHAYTSLSLTREAGFAMAIVMLWAGEPTAPSNR